MPAEAPQTHEFDADGYPVPVAPRNVVEALARVQGAIGGISKRTAAERGRSGDGNAPSYAYRGIDDVTTKCQSLFAEHGVVVVPFATSCAIDPVQVGGKPWTATTIEVVWRIYGPGGVADMIEARTYGLGYDNSDKGVNKATTSAYKNLLLRLLTIGDPADDTDHTSPQRDEDQRSPEQRQRDEDDAVARAQGWTDYAEWQERYRANVARARHLTDQAEDIATEWKARGLSGNVRTWTPATMLEWEKLLDEFEFAATSTPETLPLDGNPG